MKTFLLLALTTTIATSALFARTASTPEPIPSASSARGTRVKRTMKPFRSERELARYFAALAEKHRRKEAPRAAKAQREARRKALQEARRAAKPSGDMVIVTASEPAMLQSMSSVVVQSVTEAVTNIQHAGVDEGGIVKVHGNHLVGSYQLLLPHG